MWISPLGFAEVQPYTKTCTSVALDNEGERTDRNLTTVGVKMTRVDG